MKVIRYQIADYLGITSALPSPTTTFYLMGLGFSSLDEEPSPKVNKTPYINDRSVSGTITGYENSFPFETHLDTAEEAVKALYQVSRNQKTGSDAEFDYVRVDLFEPISAKPTAYTARKFRVAAEISSIAGEGADLVSVSGTLHQIGDFSDGSFDVSTKTFTATAAK